MTTKKINARQRSALSAFADHDDTGYPEGVLACTARALLVRGLIEVVRSSGIQCSHDYIPNFFGKGHHTRRVYWHITKYAVTEAGRKTLRDA